MKTTTREALELFTTPIADVAAGTKREEVYLSLEAIEPDPEQPRKNADAELEGNIRSEGVLQAITVRRQTDPKKLADGILYIIKDGERRYWGALAAKLTTIPAVIDDRTETPLQRLVRQFRANDSKRLGPIDEAFALRRLRDEGGLNVTEVAEIANLKRTTVADRLALADAPEPFQQFFLSGILGEAAAPLLKKYAEVPLSILRKAAEFIVTDLEWARAIEAHKPVPLNAVRDGLEREILKKQLREVPSAVVLLYHGPRVTIDKVEYACDLEQLASAERKHQKDLDAKLRSEARDDAKAQSEARERQAQAPSPEVAKDDPERVDHSEWETLHPPKAAATAPAAPKAPAKSASQRKEEERDRKDAERAQHDGKRWEIALPEIRAAIATAMRSADAKAYGPLANCILQSITSGEIMDFDAKRTEDVLPRGITSTDFLRFTVMCVIDSDLYDDHFRSEVPRRLKELGLMVDVRKLLDAVKLHGSVTKKAPESVSPVLPKQKVAPKPKVSKAKPAKGAAKKGAKKSAAKKPAKKK